MNYPYPITTSPYIQAAMSQAVQAFMSGGPLPSNCGFVAMPFPQLLPPTYPQSTPYYGPSPYTNVPAPSPPQKYNYPVVPYKQPSKRKSSRQPHSNIYNSTSFDSYMENLSWSRIFDRPNRKNSKPQTRQQQQQQKTEAQTTQKNSRSGSSSSSSSSSSASDETIRRVNVANNPLSTNDHLKQQTKSNLPFKYSSEFVPGLNGQQQQTQSQKIKSNDVFIIKKA